jgi:hypothetical protein
MASSVASIAAKNSRDIASSGGKACDGGLGTKPLALCVAGRYPHRSGILLIDFVFAWGGVGKAASGGGRLDSSGGVSFPVYVSGITRRG